MVKKNTRQDFVREFGSLEMTNLSPDSLTDDDVMGATEHRWEMSVFEGGWIRGSTAGGCRNYLREWGEKECVCVWRGVQIRI